MALITYIAFPYLSFFLRTYKEMSDGSPYFIATDSKEIRLTGRVHHDGQRFELPGLILVFCSGKVDFLYWKEGWIFQCRKSCFWLWSARPGLVFSSEAPSYYVPERSSSRTQKSESDSKRISLCCTFSHLLSWPQVSSGEQRLICTLTSVDHVFSSAGRISMRDSSIPPSIILQKIFLSFWKYRMRRQ